MTIGGALKWAETELNRAEIASARLDSELLLGHVLAKDRSWLHAHATDELETMQMMTFRDLIERRSKRAPLVHLTGHREFYGLELEITPNVLTPRVETEQMVDWAIKYAPKDGRLIDIGTGSGAIAIAIAKHRPDLSVAATEVSTAALSVAQKNAEVLGVSIELVESDLWAEVNGVFDVVVTNLPYLRDDAREELMPEVRHEPEVALFGGVDGLDLYRRFLAGLSEHLSPGGYLFTECDPWQHAELIDEAADIGLTPIEQGYFILGFKRDEQ